MVDVSDRPDIYVWLFAHKFFFRHFSLSSLPNLIKPGFPEINYALLLTTTFHNSLGHTLHLPEHNAQIPS